MGIGENGGRTGDRPVPLVELSIAVQIVGLAVPVGVLCLGTQQIDLRWADSVGVGRDLVEPAGVVR